MFEIGIQHPVASGWCLLAGAALALALGWLRCERARLPRARVAAVTVLLPLLAAFFSHLCYCLVDVAYILNSHSAGYLLAFWQSGAMMYGGLLGAVLALALAGGKRRAAFWEQYAPSVALMIAAARLAEGFAGQGYGEYWMGETTALCRFPFMVYDPYYEAWAWALFVAEALVALALFAALLCRKPQREGDGMLLLMGLYASAQIILESLRRDEYLRWGFVRVEQVLSAAAILVVLCILCARAPKGRLPQKAACFGVFALMVVCCVLLEFATEGRIPFLMFLEVWQCYALIAAASAVSGACVLWMRRLSIRQ